MQRGLPLKAMSYVNTKSVWLNLQQLGWYVGEDIEAAVVQCGSNHVWVILLLTASGLVTDEVFSSYFI